MSVKPVLLTWVAVNNDPYERDIHTGITRIVDGTRIPGPTITILFDEESPYSHKITDVVLLHREKPGSTSDREKQAVSELCHELSQQSIRVRTVPWAGDDPTDHREIFEFLRKSLPEIRRDFDGRELVIHISPGTPSMHTVWVVAAETGFIERPFTVVKSYRPGERRGRPAVVPVEIGLETYYKAFRASRPRQVASEDQRVVWDPARFVTAAMRRVFAEARRYAQLNIPVLIRGERGTGKTTLAGWIRSNSPFKRNELDTNWPSVSCGQYNSETMRAELFGYKRGAFTGAMTDREGLLAAAHQDTLFLDEIGDVSRDLQRLLIRAIEEKRYYALGDDKPRKSHFRLLTATNIADDELRRRLDLDFLDRISPLTLEIPPLRDIPAELSWLWEAVYQEAAGRAGVPKSQSSLSNSHHKYVVAKLSQYPLEGNLRDLFRVAYRILAALIDIDTQVTSEDAVEAGLEVLRRSPTKKSQLSTMSKALAHAFSTETPLADLFEIDTRIETKEVFADFRAFIASELRRMAADRAIAVDKLCDVSERTIREWEKHRKNFSGHGKNSSGPDDS